MSADTFFERKKDIDITATLSQAWALFAQKPAEHVITGLVVALLATLTLGILAGPLFCGYIKMVHKQQRGEAISVSDIWLGMEVFAPAFATTLVVALCVVVGSLVFVVPGLMAALIWGFALWFVALKDESAVGALGASFRLLKSNPNSVLVIVLAIVLLNAAGLVLVALGLLVSLPFSIILASVAFEGLTRADS